MKKRQIALWVIISTLFISPLLAGELTISVLQKGTGDAVEGATVAIQGTDEYDTTNEKGDVSFEDIDYPIKIKILNTGYETFETQIVSEKERVTFYIEPLMYEGESLEVTAERVKEKASKITLSREELRRAPGSQGDPLKVIQSMPGVVTAAEGAGVMYVRGSEPNQNIVWVNRARIGYLYHFGGLHSTISPQLIQDFNMFLGGFPVEYGDSMGGALDVKLRAPKNDRIHQTYSIGTYESSFVIEGPIGKADSKDSFYVSARRSYIDFLMSPDTFSKAFSDEEDPEEEQDKITEVPSFYDVQAVWQRDLKDGRLLLQYFGAGDKIRLDLNSPSKSDPQAQGQLSSSIEFRSTSLVWEQQWSPTLNTSSSLYYINQLSSTRIGEDENGDPFFLKIEDNNFIWQPEARWNVNKNLILTGGTEFIYAEAPVDAYISRLPGFDDVDYNLTESKKFRINTRYKTGLINPYAKIRHTWNKFTAQLGVRGTYLKSNGREEMKHVSPRFSAEYALSNKTVFTANWGKYIQLPDGAFWIRNVGNPKLDFLSSEHRILGVRHKLSSLWSTQFEVYHKPMKNLVVNYETREPPNNYTNEGSGESFGFDLLIKRDFSQGIMGWLSYSYLESTRRQKGETSPFLGDQRHTLTLVWSQPLKKDWKKWTVGFRLRANSGKPYTPVLSREGRCIDGETIVTPCTDQENAEDDPGFLLWSPNTGAKNSARLPNFFQLDLRIDREARFNTWKLNFYLDILNALNTENISGFDYGNAYENINSPRKQAGLGLFPSFGVEANF